MFQFLVLILEKMDCMLSGRKKYVLLFFSVICRTCFVILR